MKALPSPVAHPPLWDLKQPGVPREWRQVRTEILSGADVPIRHIERRLQQSRDDPNVCKGRAPKPRCGFAKSGFGAKALFLFFSRVRIDKPAPTTHKAVKDLRETLINLALGRDPFCFAERRGDAPLR